MFHKADLVLISKIDLLPHLPDISIDRIVDALQRVMPQPRYLAVSGRTGQGIDAWVDWLFEQERLVAPGQPAADVTHTHV
jgi:hydrogenase nickel incorporation protein HypB